MLSLQNAKNTFSAVVAAALDGRPQGEAGPRSLSSRRPSMRG